MSLTRRQLLISASAAAAAGGIGALIATGDSAPSYTWTAAALGGKARVALYGADRDTSATALAAVASEIERLENTFSLHREQSELSRLNRGGMLAAPSRDLVELLQSSLVWRQRTGGAFDVSIQPVWRTVAAGGAATPKLLACAGATIEATSQQIAMPAGTELTFNGIAQGRIADRVTEVLTAHGFTDVVIDAGELRLPGKNRRAVGIPAAKAAVSVAEIAIATSEPKSQVFDQKTFRHHLIDPRNGDSPRHWLSISVFAHTAEAADALSTALAVMPYEQAADLAATLGDIAVIGEDGAGRIRRFGDLRLAGLGGARA